MIELSDLPAVNATLNSIAFVLLVIGYAMIRRGRVTAHKSCMIAAFCVSILFLGSYLTYRTLGDEKKFGGQGLIRSIYLSILFSHVVLAATVPFLASWTLYLGLRGRIDRHRRLAKLTFPIWAYVSITGVIVYVLLFRIYGPVALGPIAGVPDLNVVRVEVDHADGTFTDHSFLRLVGAAGAGGDHSTVVVCRSAGL